MKRLSTTKMNNIFKTITFVLGVSSFEVTIDHVGLAHMCSYL
jgi:hypothetical protein